MSENDQMEKLITGMAEVTNLLKEKHDKGEADELDINVLAERVVELTDEKQKADFENQPNRKGDDPELGEHVWVGEKGFREKVPIIQSGKFSGEKLSDVQFAGNLINRIRQLDKNGARPLTPEMTKLLTATGAGTGDELVPRGLAAELWADTFLASKVVGAIGKVSMPTDPWDFPLSWGSITWRKATGGEAPSAQDPETAKTTFTATEIIAEVDWQYDLDEDAVIAVLPTLRQELSRSGAENMDAFILNADDTAAASGNINLDDATPPADAYYLSNGQAGIRHYYLVDRTGQSADVSTTLTDALWRAGVAKAGKYAARPNEMAAITNVKTYLLSILGLTNVRTLDKYGPGATVLTGELAKMDGMPIIVSESMPLAEDDGKVSDTAVNNDEGQIAFPHLPSWLVGFRRELMIEVDKDIRKRVFIMVASYRIAVVARDNQLSTTRSNDHTSGIHGITYS